MNSQCEVADSARREPQRGQQEITIGADKRGLFQARQIKVNMTSSQRDLTLIMLRRKPDRERQSERLLRPPRRPPDCERMEAWAGLLGLTLV